MGSPPQPISSDEPHVQRDGLVQAAKHCQAGSGVEHENSKFKAFVFRVIAALHAPDELPGHAREGASLGFH